MDSKATEREILELENKLLHPTAEPISLPLHFLRSITRDFSEEQKIGSGGYGVVYKGLLRGGDSFIAVKKIHDEHLLHDDQFLKEATFLMGIQHPNVVRFLGYCFESKGEITQLPNGKYVVAEKQAKMLCFEYLCKEGLDKYLSDESSGLEWNMRYKIIKGICNGLNFLHECNIVHLDLKPQNILMDASMMPKIADFGLSRLLGKEKSYTVTVNLAGSRGYMAPEYLDKGVISNQADIFSFGVIVIEILKGCKDDYPDYCRSTKTDFQNFTEKVLSNWRNRFQRASNYTELELHTLQVKQCIDIALQCVHHDKEKRPKTFKIIEILNAEEGSSVQNDKGLLVDHQVSQLPFPKRPPTSGPRRNVVILYAFDCTTSTTAWRTVDRIFWMVQKKLTRTQHIHSCLGYLYFMKDDKTYYKFDMKLVDTEENMEKGYKKSSKSGWEYCTENIQSGLNKAQEMIKDIHGYLNGVILLFSDDGLIQQKDFFDVAEEFKFKVPVHTFTLGEDNKYNKGLRAIAESSPGGHFHDDIPVPERPMLSERFPLLLDSIIDGTTFKKPRPGSETQRLDVVLVYAFDCTESTPAWKKADHSIFWMVQERLTRLKDSCMGYIYPMLTKNNYTSDMKIVDRADSKATGYNSFDWRRLPCTKGMASGLKEANKMLRNRDNNNGIILFFSDGLINKGEFFDGTDKFESKFPVQTFTLGGDAYNEDLQAIADKSPGGKFHHIPFPDLPEESVRFKEILDSLLSVTKTN